MKVSWKSLHSRGFDRDLDLARGLYRQVQPVVYLPQPLPAEWVDGSAEVVGAVLGQTRRRLERVR